MKSYCKGLVITEEIVRDAFYHWREGEAGRKNGWRVKQEHGTDENLIAEIYEEIRERRLACAPIRYRTHVETSNGKERIIAIESVKQQVLDYVFHDCIEPMLDAKLGYYQTASIAGKGQVWAKRHIVRWMHEGGYWVKTDFRKCYPSAAHSDCMRLGSTYIKSCDVVYLMKFLLSTYRDTRSEYKFAEDRGKRGLNIGSRFSLDMMNLILSFAYHHIESLHKERRGKKVALVAHQLWFMDDCLLMGQDKRSLKAAVRSMGRYMREEFGMELKPWKVCRVDSEPITMCGFTFRPDRTTVASGTFLRAKRCYSRMLCRPCLDLARRACSYYGWLKHSDSFGFMERNGVWKALRMARRIVSENDRRMAWNAM